MASWWGSHSRASALLLAATLWGCGISLGACGGSSEVPDAPDPNLLADAGSEGPSPEVDAASGSDSGPDAAWDAAAKSFCASRSPAPRFCDDFGDGDLEDDWDAVTVLNGEPALDGVEATSPPLALVVGTPPIDQTESAHAHLRKTATGAPTGHVVFSFELRLATTSYTQGVVGIATLDVSPNHFFTLYLRDGDLDAPAATLEEISPSGTTRHLLSKLPAANTWTRATIDIDIGGSKASVLWGNEKVLDQVATAGGAAKDPTIRVGAVYIYGPADGFEARFDDVTLDF